MLRGEFTSSEPVTVAIPTGRLVESSDRPSAPLTDPEHAGTAAAEVGPSRQRKKLVASSTSESSTSSSSEEVKEEMLRHRGQRYVAKDLSAAAFGDFRGEALYPLQAASVASASTSTVAADDTPATPATEMAPAAVAGANPSAAAEVGLASPPAAIVVDDSPPPTPLVGEVLPRQSRRVGLGRGQGLKSRLALRHLR